MNKLLIALIAGAFALTASAQTTAPRRPGPAAPVAKADMKQDATKAEIKQRRCQGRPDEGQGQGQDGEEGRQSGHEKSRCQGRPEEG